MVNHSNFVEITDGLISNKKYDEAEQICKNILKSDPQNSMALNQLGGIFFSRGNISVSKTHFENSVKYNQNNLEALQNLGETLILTGNYFDALIIFINFLINSPGEEYIQKRIEHIKKDLSPEGISLLKKYYEFENSFPGTFTIETALACNLKCPECAIGGDMINSRDKGYLSFDKFKIIADKIRPYAKYLYLHLWGEPMLNKYIIQMIKYVSEFTKTNISTNGTFLNERLAEELISSGVSEIIVSIDGVTQEVYEKYRVGGKVEDAFRGLQYLTLFNQKYGNKVSIIPQFIVFKHNQHELEHFRTICNSLGLTAQFKSPYIRREDSSFELSDSSEHHRDYYSDIPSLKNAMSACVNPRDVFTINVDGSAIICCHDFNKQTNTGNIFDQSVKEIWDNPVYRTYRWNIIKGDAPEFCVQNCLTYNLIKKKAGDEKQPSELIEKNELEEIKIKKSKINLCSGTINLDDYTNIDIGIDADISLDLEKDLLPFDDESIDAVVCISAINYFTPERGAEIIKDVYRVLKQGGIARFASQDLKILTEKYLSRDEKFYFEKLQGGSDRYPGETFAGKLNNFFYGFEVAGKNCKYVYDYETLELVFKRAGFNDVSQRKFRESLLTGIEKIDNRPEQMFFLEAFKGNPEQELNDANVEEKAEKENPIITERNQKLVIGNESYKNEIEWQIILQDLNKNNSDRELVIKTGKILEEKERFENAVKLYTNYLAVNKEDQLISDLLKKARTADSMYKSDLISDPQKISHISKLDQTLGHILTDDEHLAGAMRWLAKAFEATGKRGVSALYNLLNNNWDVAYPETTGYIIPTFLYYSSLSDHAKYKDYALEMGEWELSIQWKDGGVGEPVAVYGLRPRIFNTAQVMLGWMALYRETWDKRFLNAAIKAADWIVAAQDDDGKWFKNTYRGAKTYHARVAWVLLELFEFTNNTTYKHSAERYIRWNIKKAYMNGWFADTSLGDENKPWTHLIGYTLVGLLKIYTLDNCNCDTSILKNLLIIAAQNLYENYFGKNSSTKIFPGLPGTLDKNWNSSDNWSCLTGNAQIEFFLRMIAKIINDENIKSFADQLSDDIKRTQFMSKGIDRNIFGSLAGSYPVSGEYCPYFLPNWGAKFWADSLMQKMYPYKNFRYLS
jgi:MoaA/NifB/PqqE/SkfB family radical SAM enzyme/predicted SAM-dependent methyltransferase